MFRSACVCMTVGFSFSPFSSAASVAVSGYTYLSTADSSGYRDASHAGAGTLGELTDGITSGRAWSIPAQTISLADVDYLVGWGNSDPAVSFSFGSTQTVGAVIVWIADSDNSAGVKVPVRITIRTPDSSFLRTFVITDPVGSGTTVPFTFSGFSLETDALIVEAERSSFWTMFSEVEFNSIPEPSYPALLALGLGLAAKRRRM